MASPFKVRLTSEQRGAWQSLTSPANIQAFLDTIPYSAEDANRSPLRVLQERQAHCLDGGLFAAAALRQLGHPPLIVDLLPDPGTDDDHVLAIFRRNGCFGAVAKSNFAGLRYREPVYRSLRNLVMSYFEVYFNVRGEKTLRSYTVRSIWLPMTRWSGWQMTQPRMRSRNACPSFAARTCLHRR